MSVCLAECPRRGQIAGKTSRIVASDVESALEPARAFVVHAGDDRYPLSESVEAIGVRELAGELRGRS